MAEPDGRQHRRHPHNNHAGEIRQDSNPASTTKSIAGTFVLGHVRLPGNSQDPQTGIQRSTPAKTAEAGLPAGKHDGRPNNDVEPEGGTVYVIIENIKKNTMAWKKNGTGSYIAESSQVGTKYGEGYVDIFMPNHIHKQLTTYRHNTLKLPQHCPY